MQLWLGIPIINGEITRYFYGISNSNNWGDLVLITGKGPWLWFAMFWFEKKKPCFLRSSEYFHEWLDDQTAVGLSDHKPNLNIMQRVEISNYAWKLNDNHWKVKGYIPGVQARVAPTCRWLSCFFAKEIGPAHHRNLIKPHNPGCGWLSLALHNPTYD